MNAITWTLTDTLCNTLEDNKRLFLLPYLCLCAYSGVQHILCCVFALFIIRLVYPMLPVSLDCPFLIAPSVFSNVNSQCYVTCRELILKLHMINILWKIKTFDFCIDIGNHFNVFNMWRYKCALTIWDFHFIAQKTHRLKVFFPSFIPHNHLHSI